jgi:hypothetical protein
MMVATIQTAGVRILLEVSEKPRFYLEDVLIDDEISCVEDGRPSLFSEIVSLLFSDHKASILLPQRYSLWAMIYTSIGLSGYHHRHHGLHALLSKPRFSIACRKCSCCSHFSACFYVDILRMLHRQCVCTLIAIYCISPGWTKCYDHRAMPK